MSHINVTGVVNNHGVRSNIFSPLVEAVINSIDAIEDRGISHGEINVLFKRDSRPSLFDKTERSKPEIVGIEIIDNGIGFNEENRNSFDTFYSSYKQPHGGKGFGRFMYKKYFNNVKIESIFEDNKKYKKRIFNFGSEDEIIEKDSETVENIFLKKGEDLRTTVILENIKQASYPKELETIAKMFLEKILVYFITDGYVAPIIILQDDNGKKIILNDLAKNSQEILALENTTFELVNDKKKEKFNLKIFKIFSPSNQNSKIVLTADKREVVDTPLYDYIPEFKDEFLEQIEGRKMKNNFIIKAYVLGLYLDNNVTIERDNFLFEKEKDLFYPFSRRDIEEKSIKIIEEKFSYELSSRREKKRQKVSEFLKDHPWFKDLDDEINWNDIPMNPTEEKIESVMHEISYRREKNAKIEINRILEKFDQNIPIKINEIVSKIDQVKKSELTHYISLRKVFLDVFKHALAINDDGKKHEKENLLHSIIFPTKKDSDILAFDEHNLWILDERLNFVDYLRSDMSLDDEIKKRPDILAFDHKISFRGGEEPSNPVSVFEFKRPGRDDFTDKSSKEDPHDQVIDYVEKIKEGKYTTPQNREIQVSDGTPFYGYIIADKTPKVEKWLKNKDFKPLPDGQRWFKWQTSYNLYLEFITWDQLSKDAELRNKIFFHKLGI